MRRTRRRRYRHTNSGAKCARLTREQLGIEPTARIACVVTTVEERFGIPVTLLTLPDGVEGAYAAPGGAPSIYVRGGGFAPRAPFTLAHELGHVRCGHAGRIIIDTVDTVGRPGGPPHEQQANAFAAEFLAPADGVDAIVDGRWADDLEVVVDVAAHFGVSTQVAFYQCSFCGHVKTYADTDARIRDGAHHPIWEARDVPTSGDILGTTTTDDLPRVSPLVGDGALRALLGGGASVEDAAGRDLDRVAALRDGLGLLGA